MNKEDMRIGDIDFINTDVIYRNKSSLMIQA